MANFTLTTSNDTFAGTSGNDLFSGPSGGTDTLSGKGGNDTFQINAGEAGHISGGAGADVVDALGIDLGSLTFSGVETLDLYATNELYATAAQLQSFGGIQNTYAAVYDTFHITGAGGRVNFLSRWSGGADLHIDATASTAAVTIISSFTNDTITGSYYADRLFGEGGNDSITVNGAHGFASGGTGADFVFGVGAYSQIYGDAGSDTLYASGDHVTLHGGLDNDTLYANSTNAVLYGDSGSDTLHSSVAGAVLNGGSDNDFLHAGADNVTLNGDNGNDTIYDDFHGAITINGGYGSDTIVLTDSGAGSTGTVDGGTGSDQVIEYGIDLGARSFTNVEALVLANHAYLYATASQLNSFQVIQTTNGATADTIYVTGAGGTIDFSQSWKPLTATLTVDASNSTAAVTITGTARDDVLHGSNFADRLYGGLGIDTIVAHGDGTHAYGGGRGDTMTSYGANTILHGDDGYDTITMHGANSVANGGNGSDTIYSDGVNNNLVGDAGSDTLTAAAANNTLFGGLGNDHLYAQASGAVLYGDSGADDLHGNYDGAVLNGGADGDTLYAYADNLTLNGDNGNDTIIDLYNGVLTVNAGDGSDTIILTDCGCASGTIDGGAGSDHVVEYGIDLGARVFTNVEALVLANYSYIYASAAQLNSFQVIQATNGAPGDTIFITGAGGTVDFTDSWKPFATLTVDAYYSTAAVNVTGTARDDIILGSNYADTLNGGLGLDTIKSYGDGSIVHGDGRADTLTNYGDNSLIYGDSGNDTITDKSITSSLYGGSGDDTFNVTDTALASGTISGGSSSSSGAGDTINEHGIDLGGRVISSVETLNLATHNYITGTAAQFSGFQHIYDTSSVGTGTTVYLDGAGGSLNFTHSWTESRTLTIDASAATSGETVKGSVYGAVFIGSAYDDRFTGDDGNDTMHGGAGTNVLSGMGGNDFLYAQGTGDTLAGGDGNDTLVDLSAGTSTLNGGDGTDSLNGGAGGDKMSGGAGADTFVFSAVSDSDGTNFDHISDFTDGTDSFDLWFAVTGIDATIASGTLRGGAFTSDMATAVDAAHLQANHAVLFTPDSGSFSGKTFMVVDVNGVDGYQAGQDLVMQVDNVTVLHTGDFI